MSKSVYRVAVIWLCFLTVVCISRQLSASDFNRPAANGLEMAARTVYAPPAQQDCARPAIEAAGKPHLGAIQTGLPVGMMFLQAYWDPSAAYSCAAKACTVAALVSFAMGPGAFVAGCTGSAGFCLMDNVNWDNLTMGLFGGSANRPIILEHLSQ